MDKQKLNLIIKNLETLIELLKLELNQEEEKNIIAIDDLIKSTIADIDNYEPDYYEEED